MNGTRNTLGDLNNHLFEQLERLNDTDLVGDQLKQEIDRAKTVAVISHQVISGAGLVLEGQKVIGDSLNANAKLPRVLDSE